MNHDETNKFKRRIWKFSKTNHHGTTRTLPNSRIRRCHTGGNVAGSTVVPWRSHVVSFVSFVRESFHVKLCTESGQSCKCVDWMWKQSWNSLAVWHPCWFQTSLYLVTYESLWVSLQVDRVFSQHSVSTLRYLHILPFILFRICGNRTVGNLRRCYPLWKFWKRNNLMLYWYPSIILWYPHINLYYKRSILRVT